MKRADSLEQLQCRATKMIWGLEHMTQKEMLRELSPCSALRRQSWEKNWCLHLHVGMTHVGMESDSSLRCMVVWQRAKGMPWNILNFLERLWNLHLWRHSKVDNRGLSTAAWWDLLWALCWTTWLPEVPSYLNYNSVQLSNKKHRTTNGSGEGNHYLVKGNPRESKNVWLGRWKIQTHYQRWCRTWKFMYNAMFKFTETKEE